MFDMGSIIAAVMFFSVVGKYLVPEWEFYFSVYTRRLRTLVYSYIQIKFPEYTGDDFRRSTAYSTIEAYLANICSDYATKLKADIGRDSNNLSLSMDENEEIADTYEGVKVWWSSTVKPVQKFSFYSFDEDRRFYTLTFHARDRGFVNTKYMPHVMEEGKAVEVRRRQRRLYTNNNSRSEGGFSRYGSGSLWSHVPFDHPATFKTVAMAPEKREEIVRDLLAFSKNKDYYDRIGKAWKRGYLLYGPPGTGKTSMIAAMANLLEYDVYDLELTAVPNNTMLRKLLIETKSKSILVIEDIDCSLDLVGKRSSKPKKKEPSISPDEAMKSDKDDADSKVTLSGMLNFIDGLWSACGTERLIVLTTNHMEKLDPALTRRGRMDVHVELSYCGFEAFKVLAKNYLDVEWHYFFDEVREVMARVEISPADVAECLIPKQRRAEKDEEVSICLKKLLATMEELHLGSAKRAAEEEDIGNVGD